MYTQVLDQTNLVYSSASVRDYTFYNNRNPYDYNRRAIDGRIVGCGKCVGYCQYREHPGFLTESLRKEHNCIKKQCDYYLSKPTQSRTKIKKLSILNLIEPFMTQYDGLKIIRAESDDNDTWNCYYITITNSYSETDIESILFQQTAHTVRLIRLNLDYEVCAKLIMNA